MEDIEIIFYLTNREILHLTRLILSKIFSERCFLFYTRLQCLNLALKSLLLIPELSIVNAKCFNWMNYLQIYLIFVQELTSSKDAEIGSRILKLEPDPKLTLYTVVEEYQRILNWKYDRAKIGERHFLKLYTVRLKGKKNLLLQIRVTVAEEFILKWIVQSKIKSVSNVEVKFIASQSQEKMLTISK